MISSTDERGAVSPTDPRDRGSAGRRMGRAPDWLGTRRAGASGGQSRLVPESVPDAMHMFHMLTQQVIFGIIHDLELAYGAVDANTLARAGKLYR